MIIFYISGHGFGHASRQIEIINALHAAAPAVALAVRTSAPRWLFDLTLRAPVTFEPVECDTGIAQIDSLRLDEAETVRRAAAFQAGFSERVGAEAALLAARGAVLVVGDVPPLAFAAASRAGVPSIAIANFTWDWILAEYEEELARQEAHDVVPRMAEAYACATMAWRLPMAGGFKSFRAVDDLPFVARRSRRDPADVRRMLALPADRPLVLISYGGYGVSGLQVPDTLASRYALVATAAGRTAEVPGVRIFDEADLYRRGLRYEDLVAAAAVVATKPGYGIVAECVANDAAVLYTPRGRFREYPVLVREMPRWLRCACIDHDDLFAGRWTAHVDRLLGQSRPPERARVDGADVAARRILAMLS